MSAPLTVFDIVLFEPEIPPNTGNALRLASNTGARLHLVRPLGFTLRDRQLTRAGLHYADLSSVVIHGDWRACHAYFGQRRMFAVTTRGSQRFDVPAYREDDVFVFGPETRGLPRTMIEALPEDQRIRVPMRAGQRSLNLSNAVAVVIYEAWRQHGYAGADDKNENEQGT
jgi:tRNA (cytidine/uridine-2'-O-)-methyltransferase